MDERTIKEDTAARNEGRRRAVHYRLGEITDDTPLSVDLGDSGVPLVDVKRLASYTPTVGDLVLVAVFGNDLCVLGEIA